jgi:ferrochelatase
VTSGLLLMAYGTPSSPEEVEAYYTDIRRGRPPTPEQLADLVRRYDAIGGLSPLRQRTEAQRNVIRRALPSWRVELGYKHAHPMIEEAREQLNDCDRVVGLVLAPHYSALSVGEYLERAGADLGIECWYDEPAYTKFLAGAVRDGLAKLPAKTKVLFTAHSLPSRVIDMGDPYPHQLRANAEAVAAAADLHPWSGWTIAWQSAARTPEPWLGPDVAEVIRELGATGRSEGVLVCPCGFVSDHLEVLYDLDIEAARVAQSVGLQFGRTRVLNDDPNVLEALATRVRSLGSPRGGSASS